MKNDILVVRKDHIVNRIRCKEKKIWQKTIGKIVYFFSEYVSYNHVASLCKSINIISFNGNLNILNTSLDK